MAREERLVLRKEKDWKERTKEKVMGSALLKE
jgi:hypothetical protein